jgi:lactate dehydrogenase-like 2-hydroxyacid dehydrogenase
MGRNPWSDSFSRFDLWKKYFPMTRDVMGNLPKLKSITIIAAGCNNIDTE